MTESEAVEVVRAGLETTTDQCYVASEAVYHLLGGKDSGYTPMQVWIGSISHWYLKAEDGHYVDPTADQFVESIDSYYPKGTGRGFLSAQPCKRTKNLLTKTKRCGHGHVPT